ncbi:MAG: EamA family transporter [Bacteroidetes bacterium]|nr:EamA family transporter [Bacteroidota bacterium]
MKHLRQHSASTWKLMGAFTAVYLIWGSTYLAIRFAIESMPPLIMLGARFGLAGILLYCVMRGLGVEKPDRGMWKSGFLIGALTLGVGTGAVAWAEYYIASGIAALLVTTVPLWMVLLQWKWKKGPRPNAAVFGGLLLGALGIVLLVNPVDFVRSASWHETLAMVAILVGSFSWSFGSLLSRDVRLPKSPFMSTALQMVGGGLSLLIAGFVRGEAAQLDVLAITRGSWLALGYLFIFGSIIAFSSYVWLMKNAPSEKVATYAYVNPVVAVLLGWLLAGELLSARIVFAMIVLVSAVVVISRYGSRALQSRKQAPVWLRKESWIYALDRPAQSLDRKSWSHAKNSDV